MAGYTRQSSFADGDTITAALFNNEYNQLVNAFHNATGHSHDGTAASGPVIGLIGDAGETSPNNKVLIDGLSVSGGATYAISLTCTYEHVHAHAHVHVHYVHESMPA